MHLAYANFLTPIIELPKLGMTSPSISLGGKLYGIRFLCEEWMKLLSSTAIFFLDVPIVGSPASLESFVVMKRPVAPMSKIPMATRVWSLKPMMCGLSCVLKVCVVEMMSLKCMSCPLLWWLVGGVVCTGQTYN